MKLRKWSIVAAAAMISAGLTISVGQSYAIAVPVVPAVACNGSAFTQAVVPFGVSFNLTTTPTNPTPGQTFVLSGTADIVFPGSTPILLKSAGVPMFFTWQKIVATVSATNATIVSNASGIIDPATGLPVARMDGVHGAPNPALFPPPVVSDPDGSLAIFPPTLTGDETSPDMPVTLTLSPTTWTAGASGAVDFSMDEYALIEQYSISFAWTCTPGSPGTPAGTAWGPDGVDNSRVPPLGTGTGLLGGDDNCIIGDQSPANICTTKWPGPPTVVHSLTVVGGTPTTTAAPTTTAPPTTTASPTTTAAPTTTAPPTTTTPPGVHSTTTQVGPFCSAVTTVNGSAPITVAGSTLDIVLNATVPDTTVAGATFNSTGMSVSQTITAVLLQQWADLGLVVPGDIIDVSPHVTILGDGTIETSRSFDLPMSAVASLSTVNGVVFTASATQFTSNIPDMGWTPTGPGVNFRAQVDRANIVIHGVSGTVLTVIDYSCTPAPTVLFAVAGTPVLPPPTTTAVPTTTTSPPPPVTMPSLQPQACVSSSTGLSHGGSQGLATSASRSSAGPGDGFVLSSTTFGNADPGGSVALLAYGAGGLVAGTPQLVDMSTAVTIAASNTAEMSQTLVAGSAASVTINDPDGIAGSGDESVAGDLGFATSLPDTAWTATGGNVAITMVGATTTYRVGGVVVLTLSCHAGVPHDAGSYSDAVPPVIVAEVQASENVACAYGTLTASTSIDWSSTGSPQYIDASLGAGGSSAVNVSADINIPAEVWVGLYNNGYLGSGTVVASLGLDGAIAASNSVELSAAVSAASPAMAIVVSDPDGTPATGDETASSVSFHNDFGSTTWTTQAPYADMQVAAPVLSGSLWIVGVAGSIPITCAAGTPHAVIDIVRVDTPSCHGVEADVILGNGDVLTALSNGGADVVVGTSGNDTIRTFAGDDTICGRGGNDRIVAGDGDDLIRGETGDDFLIGGSGNDTIYGGAGLDVVQAQAGNDTIDGGPGADFLVGGSGNDLIDGADGDDRILATSGDDTVAGGAGSDEVRGGSGADTISGGDGNDSLFGSTQSDIIVGGVGADTIYGEAGSDTLSGGAGNDTLNGGDGSDVLLGGDGSDNLYGGRGFDSLDGGPGAPDRCFGGPNRDTATACELNIGIP